MNDAEAEALKRRLEIAGDAAAKFQRFEQLGKLAADPSWDRVKFVPRDAKDGGDGGLDVVFACHGGGPHGFVQFPAELNERLFDELRQALGMIADAGRAEFQKAYDDA